MNALEAWNTLSWVDGMVFSIWVGIMYYAKCWIDNSFRNKSE